MVAESTVDKAADRLEYHTSYNSLLSGAAAIDHRYQRVSGSEKRFRKSTLESGSNALRGVEGALSRSLATSAGLLGGGQNLAQLNESIMNGCTVAMMPPM